MADVEDRMVVEAFDEQLAPLGPRGSAPDRGGLFAPERQGVVRPCEVPQRVLVQDHGVFVAPTDRTRFHRRRLVGHVLDIAEHVPKAPIRSEPLRMSVEVKEIAASAAFDLADLRGLGGVEGAREPVVVAGPRFQFIVIGMRAHLVEQSACFAPAYGGWRQMVDEAAAVVAEPLGVTRPRREIREPPAIFHGPRSITDIEAPYPDPFWLQGPALWPPPIHSPGPGSATRRRHRRRGGTRTRRDRGRGGRRRGEWRWRRGAMPHARKTCRRDGRDGLIPLKNSTCPKG